MSGTNIYEITAGPDITGDGVNEVYYGTVSGLVACLDGATGDQVWSMTADPEASRNVLSMTAMPDVTGDRVKEIAAGTLGDHIVLLDGWDGGRLWATVGIGPADAVDAIGYLPDIDGNGSWEVLAGNREGLAQAFSGGGLVDLAPAPRTMVPAFALGAAYPNPFNVLTVIPYSLARDGHVVLSVYDLLGRRVTTLVDGARRSSLRSAHSRGSASLRPRVGRPVVQIPVCSDEEIVRLCEIGVHPLDTKVEAINPARAQRARRVRWNEETRGSHVGGWKRGNRRCFRGQPAGRCSHDKRGL